MKPACPLTRLAAMMPANPLPRKARCYEARVRLPTLAAMAHASPNLDERAAMKPACPCQGSPR